MTGQLTHFNEQNRAKIVDMTAKTVTKRQAVAVSRVIMLLETLTRIKEGNMKKGDVLAVAEIAGVMAAKTTSEMIPKCHPIPLTGVDIHFEDWNDDRGGHGSINCCQHSCLNA
jgi:cyclic pyranopterin monophosphate synthase